jgi:hypothetical protein
LNLAAKLKAGEHVKQQCAQLLEFEPVAMGLEQVQWEEKLGQVKFCPEDGWFQWHGT